MKTNIEDIEKIVAVAVWADGEFAEAEKIVVSEVAKAIEADETTFVKNIEKLASEFENEDAVNNMLEKAAANVADEDVAGVIAIAIQVILADGTFSHSEAENLLAITDALGADEADVLLLVADALKDEEDIEIDLEN
ncbi:MAG: TerB family tellurite resistance protein [Paludibacteraceae bacterium]|nr:TerB family tellurite resistance protein [Candidatus Physcocola equi]MCQ2234026.1 TerB family tellurite resistance protein [Paludibacteraceae bacterium]